MHQGELLKKLMSEKGITQKILGKSLGVSRNQVNIICKQQHLGKYLTDCCKILKVSPDLFEEDKKTSHLEELVQTQRELIESLKETISLLRKGK